MRIVGIDIRAQHVNAVLLNSSYRQVAIEQMREVGLNEVASLEQALQAAVVPMAQQSDAMVVAVEAEGAFIHRITLPTTALKQLEEVLPYELEAQVPVDIEELVFDHLLLRRESTAAPLVAFVAAARLEQVKGRIELVRHALGREPERVGCGPIPLGNLSQICAELSRPEPVAIVDLGGSRTEVAMVVDGEVVFARTLTRGAQSFPEGAPALAAELRQTFVAWLGQAGATPVQRVYLVGVGPSLQGAEAWFTSQLSIPVANLPALDVTGITPEQLPAVPRFAKAISLALSAVGRSHDLDLRRGPLAYQRGFGFLKDKLPVLSGLVAAVVISFLFSTWAELRAINRQHDTLVDALEKTSKADLGTAASDADEAMNLLERAKKHDEPDPQPEVDAFDVIVDISKAIPAGLTHTIEEFDMYRGHVKLNGVATSAGDAQLIADNLKKEKCIQEVKVSKISQVINSPMQKYVLDFDVKCDKPAAVPKKKAEEADAGAGGEAP